MDMKEILKNSKTIAVVGISSDPSRTSNWVASYMQSHGYKIIPVNPKEKGKKILGEPVFDNLLSIEEGIDIVNIFRRPEFVYLHVEEAVRVHAKVVWMQLGIINREAAKLAEDNGITVIMNRCIATTHSHLSGDTV
ncbi:MAG: CoA-binding protein [Spirochaetales bacterium]|nr:CoA-binding protein [Spirochaetales bacterium]